MAATKSNTAVRTTRRKMMLGAKKKAWCKC